MQKQNWKLARRSLAYGERTLVMGVLNVTPDSFSDGGQFFSSDNAIAHAEQMIAEGAEHYAAMCTGCHLAPGMHENEMRPGLNPKPPILASLPSQDPREQFWIVKHGLKMTAMPAWGATHTDEEIWNIVAFLQKLPGMSPTRYRALTRNAIH